MNINVISLGCVKNLVDSEVLIGLLIERGHYIVPTMEEADAVILNTCAFTDEARKEAKTYIKKVIKEFIISTSEKKRKKRAFIVCGCLPNIMGEKIISEFPEVDMVFGSSDFAGIPGMLEESISGFPKVKIHSGNRVVVREPDFIYSHNFSRVYSTSPSYAYIKIADGCDNRCGYCKIPDIRGRYRERQIEDIVKEAKNIAERGIKEIILISHDTTFFGMKNYGKQMLPVLLDALQKISGINWIRILYLNINHLTEEIIEKIAESEKVCKYFDIPVQHTDDRVLENMKRPGRNRIFKTIENIRNKVKDAVLRTTVIVGHPGEDEKIFRQLLKDIKDLEFDWLGCFIYSREKGTHSYMFGDRISKEEKRKRYETVMKTQKKITAKKNKSRIGKIYDVIVENDKSAHAQFQTPEVDGKMILSKKDGKILTSGEIIKVKTLSVVNSYDLRCEVL